MSAPILSSFDWEMSIGLIRHLRAGFLDNVNNGKLQYRYVYPDGTVEWRDLMTGLTSVNFNFTNWWQYDMSQSHLLFVNGLPQIYEWSGGITTLDSTSNSAGAVSSVTESGFILPNTFGGKLYTVGDIITLTGGNDDATLRVESVVSLGAIYTINPVPDNAGTGYMVGDILTITQGSAAGGTVKVETVDGGGGILTLSLRTQGHDYFADDNLVLTGGSGTLATMEITEVDFGAITSVSIVNGGTGYAPASGISVTGGTGTGAKMEILAISNNTITKQGTKTWVEEGFYNSGTHSVTINGVDYQATGGWNSLTLVGVTPDPTGAGVAGDVIHQTVKTTLNSAMQGIPVDFENDLITTFGAVLSVTLSLTTATQLYIGSLISNQIYVSVAGVYTNYNFSFPRQSGEGIVLTSQAPPRAFIAQEDQLYVSAGLNQWYEVVQKAISTAASTIVDSQVFVTNIDVLTPTLQRLKTTGLQGAQSQAFVSKNKNDVIFVSFEPIVNTLGRVDNVVLTPQMADLSFPIVNDMNKYDFTDGSIFFWQNFILVAVPKEGLLRIYNMTKDTTTANPTNSPIHYWEAPLTMPFSRFSVIDGELYGHSYLVSETYKMFEGYNFNGHPIPALAVFAYQQYGVRPQNKSENEFYVEGYISPNATINMGINYELDGFGGQYNGTIQGTDTQIVQTTGGLNSLGKESLGKNPLGGDLVIDETNTDKFRVIKTFPRTPYYEASPFFGSSGIDYIWSLIAFGPAQLPTSEGNNAITQ